MPRDLRRGKEEGGLVGKVGMEQERRDLGKREVGSSAGIHSQGRPKSLADLQAEGGGEPGVGEIQKGERARMVRRPLFSDLGGPNEEPEPLCQKAQGV